MPFTTTDIVCYNLAMPILIFAGTWQLCHGYDRQRDRYGGLSIPLALLNTLFVPCFSNARSWVLKAWSYWVTWLLATSIGSLTVWTLNEPLVSSLLSVGAYGAMPSSHSPCFPCRLIILTDMLPIYLPPQTKRVKTTNGDRSERNGQSRGMERWLPMTMLNFP